MRQKLRCRKIAYGKKMNENLLGKRKKNDCLKIEETIQ